MQEVVILLVKLKERVSLDVRVEQVTLDGRNHFHPCTIMKSMRGMKNMTRVAAVQMRERNLN